MKTGLTILFLLLNSFGFTQKTYSSVDEEWIVLKDSIQFRYSENCHGCAIGCRGGVGTYEISEKNLILTFRPYSTRKGTYTISKDSTKNLDSVYFFNVTIIEDSIGNIGLAGANVYFKNGKELFGAATDWDGYCKLRIEATLIPDTLFISFIGFDTVKIPVENVNQSIFVYPVYIGYNEIYNEVKKFKMRGRRKLVTIE